MKYLIVKSKSKVNSCIPIVFLFFSSCATNENFKTTTSAPGLVKEKTTNTKTSSRSCTNIETILYKDTTKNKVVAKEEIKSDCIGRYEKEISREKWVLKNNKLVKVRN